MIWSLQVLRFVAALMVVYVHAAQTAFEATGSNGFVPPDVSIVAISGVDIFFVLSGAIIARIAPGLTWAAFAWRRLRRIAPFYLLCCLPAVLIAAKTEFGWREAVATFLLWPATDVMTAPALLVAWTLCFEMLFYAGAALTLADRRWAIVLLAFFAAAFVLRPLGPVFQFLGNPLILEFMLGVAIAYAPMQRMGLWGIPIGAVALVAVGLLGVAPFGDTTTYLAGDGALWRVLVYGVPAALIVYGTMQIAAKPSVWTYLGDASYSLYLTHPLVVSVLAFVWMAHPVPADLIVAIGMLASVAFAWRVHESVERPLLAALHPSRRRTQTSLPA